MELMNNLTFENLLKNHQWTSQFNEEQLDELLDGYNNGIDVQVYADSRINEYFMVPHSSSVRRIRQPSRQHVS